MTSADAPPSFTHKQILTVVSGLMLGMLLGALDQTIVATSIRTIADDLQGYSLQAWATTAYLITATLATPLYGKLSDMYGRKPFYLAAITLFIVGSLLCTLAQSMYQLAAFRAFQGLGAGGLMSLAFAIIGDIVAPRERARYQGYFLAMFATSSVIGPVVGGVLAGQESILGISGWRWVFLVNVPIGIVALAVVYRVLNLPRYSRPGVRIDWWGAAALVIGVVPLLIVAEQGREWGWLSAGAVSCYIIGVLGIATFIAIEASLGDTALIPLRLFRNRTFALGVAISVVVGAAMFGGITLVPQYLQVVRGASPIMAGLQMTPLVLGMMIGSTVSGKLISTTGRYRTYPIVGAATVTLGLFFMHWLTAHTPLWQAMVYMAIVGLGLGNLMPPLTLAIQNAAAPSDMGVSTSAATFFRQIGGTAGVAVFLSLLFSLMPDRITHRLADVGVQPDPERVAGVMADSSLIERLNPAMALPIKEGFADAMSTVFLSASAISLLALCLVLAWKEIPLRQHSGLDSQRES